MPLKINLKLILVCLLSPLIFGSTSSFAQQTISNNIYLPLVSDDRSQWIGPYGGTIVCLAIDPSASQNIYAGTWGGGIYKSRDGGISWEAINAGLGNWFIYSLAIDPTQPTTIYAGTYRDQIYKSMDGGASWVWSGTGMQKQAVVYSLAIDPKASSIIFAGTRGASNNGIAPWSGVIYKSSNAGQTWNPVLDDVGGKSYQDWAYSLAINPKAHSVVYAATHENGTYKSLDFGINWFPANNGIADESGRAIIIDPGSQGGNTLYLGVWHDDSVYKSEDGADSWSLSNNGVPFAQVFNLDIDTIHPETLYLAAYNKGIYKTQDGGDSWARSGLQDDRVYSVAINQSSPANLLAGTEGDGIYRSSDGGKDWQPSNTGLENSMPTSVVINGSAPESLYASIYGAGVLTTTKHSLGWGGMNTGLGDKFVHMLVQNPNQMNLIYALTETGGLFKNNLNTDSGWVSFGNGLPQAAIYTPAFSQDHPFANLEMEEYTTRTEAFQAPSELTSAGLLTMRFAPSAPQTVYIGTVGYGVYKSSDAGANWKPAGLSGASILSLVVDPADANVIYAITSSPGSMKFSQNGGQTWQQASLAVTFYALAENPGYPGSILAGTSKGIYRYQAGSWNQLGLADEAVTAIATSSSQPGLIYAGTTTTAYYSVDNGLTWQRVSQNLTNLTVQAISIDPNHPNWAYFCTKTHGIYFATIGF